MFRFNDLYYRAIFGTVEKKFKTRFVFLWRRILILLIYLSQGPVLSKKKKKSHYSLSLRHKILVCDTFVGHLGQSVPHVNYWQGPLTLNLS